MNRKTFGTFSSRRIKRQAHPLEYDVVHEPGAADPEIPMEIMAHPENLVSFRVDADMTAVVFRNNSTGIFVSDEMNVPHGLNSGNTHKDADRIARVKVRSPGERPEFIRIDEAKRRLFAAEDTLGLTPG